MYKRGITPILATVLLVGFTIAIAAMVSTFLIKEVQEGFNPENIITESEFCDSVALGFEEIVEEDPSGGSDSCNGGIVEAYPGESGFSFLKCVNIKNKGQFSVWNITVIGPDRQSLSLGMVDISGGFSTLDSGVLLDGGLKPQEKEQIKVIFGGYGSNSNNEIKIIPWIKDPKNNEIVQYIVCEDSALIIDLDKVGNS